MDPMRTLMRVTTPVHAGLYRLLGGRVVGRGAGGMPLLLLTTTGRRSGQRRTVPVGYMRDGEDLLVVASGGGADRHPAWALNLRANQAATVQLGRRRFRVRAEWAVAEERDRLWERITAAYPLYRRYEGRVPRTIPVIRLRPLAPGPARTA